MYNDLWNFRGLSKNTLLEYITPYKICVVIILNEFVSLNHKNSRHYIKRVSQNLEPAYRRDFSMLSLHLIQSPDMDYEELLSLLESGKYCLRAELLENFKKEVQTVLQNDVGSIMDVLLNVDRVLTEQNTYGLVCKSSKIGLFLRRVRLFFDKLSFSQTIGAFKAFQMYVQKRKAESTKADLNESMPRVEEPLETTKESADMDLSSILDESIISPHDNQAKEKPQRLSMEGKEEGSVGLWSRKQAEFFIAQQSKMLENSPEQALPPPQLHAKIMDVLSTNPEHAEAHYLSYLNCMRSREFCGSMNSLFHYFDRKAPNTYEDESNRCKGLRYAALNLAILQASFSHKKEALYALKEAITLAHEANDNICLQHAQTWMYKLMEENKDVLIERSVSKSNELNLNYLSSFGLQSYAQYAAQHGGLPSHVFELLTKSDGLNAQHGMPDLLALGWAHKASLWSMYGRSELASFASQQLLHLATTDSTQLTFSYSGEPITLAISNLINYFTMQGEYQLAWLLVNHGKERVPGSKWWIWSENILYFTESLHKGLWQHAQTAVDQLATVDEFESLLRQSELMIAKGDRKTGLEAANKVLSKTVSPMLKIRALHLAARCNSSGSVIALANALFIANFHSIDYWMGLSALELAKIQLEMGLPCQAMKLVDQTLLGVLSHGCFADMADGIALFAQCKVATVATAPFSIRADVISEAIRLLDKATEYSKQIEDYSRVKSFVYIQALLCNTIGMIAERNKYAFEFRTLDEQLPTGNSSVFVAQ